MLAMGSSCGPGTSTLASSIVDRNRSVLPSPAASSRPSSTWLAGTNSGSSGSASAAGSGVGSAIGAAVGASNEVEPASGPVGPVDGALADGGVARPAASGGDAPKADGRPPSKGAGPGAKRVGPA